MNVGIYYRCLCIRIVFTGSRVPKPWENSLFDQSLHYNSTTHIILVLLSSFSEKCLRWRFSAPVVTVHEKNPEGNRNATTLDTHCLEGSQGHSILIEFACHHVICSAVSHQFGSPGQIDAGTRGTVVCGVPLPQHCTVFTRRRLESCGRSVAACATG